MTLIHLLSIVFFLCLGGSVFFPERALVIAYGIAAILIGILMAIGVNPSV